MSNKILIKRGSGAPTTSDLDNYEIAYDTGANKLYIRDGSDIIPFAAIVDEDNFASDDANRVPSQQSTKAYIASELAAAGAGDITAVVAGTGLSGGATSGSATLNIDSTVATLTGSQTLTNKTIASPTFTGDVTFNDASTPQLNITDTTNTVSARLAASDTTVSVGSTTDHNVNLMRNDVGHFTLYSGYTMHNNGGNDNDLRAKDSSGNVVFKVDAGDSKTHITTLKLDNVSIGAIQTGSESFADNDTSLMTSAAIQDKITSYGYITTDTNTVTTNIAGTGVSVSSGTGNSTISIGQSVGTSDTVAFGRVNLGSTNNTTYLTGDSKLSIDGYIMANAIVNTPETGSGPAAITFGDGATLGNDQISLVTAGNRRLYVASNGNVTIAENLTVNGTIGGSAIKDQDDMSSNSATHLASQQSIKAYVDAEVAGIVNSAPSALNTLDELAAALGDDANFATTTSTSLGNRLRVDTASQGLTGTQQANAITNLGITATKAELNYVDGVTSNIQTQLDAKTSNTGTITGSGVDDRIALYTSSSNISSSPSLTFDGTTLQVDNRIHLDGTSPFVRLQESGVTNTPEFWFGVDGGNLSIRLNNSGTYPLQVITNTDNDAVDSINLGYNTTVQGNVTLNGIVLDGNTITGVDDSGEFTNDDAHIMTSAGVEDKILGYGYTTNTGDITQVAITAGNGLTGSATTNSGNHSQTLTVDYLPATDDRDVKPNAITTSGVKQVRAYFTTLEGLTGSSGSDYQDLLVLDTYSDGSGGDMNALAFDKSTQNIYHYLADQSDSTWGTAKRIAYIENGSNNRVMTASSSSTVNGEGNLTFDGTNLTVAHSSGAVIFAAAHAEDKIQLYSGGNEKIGTEANTIVFTADNYKFKDVAGTTNLTLDNNGVAYLTSHLDMGDGDRIKLGDSDDLQIVHTGGINYIHSVSSNTDLYFRVNDGGTDTDAIIIDSSENGRVKLPNDNQYLTFGAGGDGVLYSYNDDFYVSNHTAGNDILFTCLNSDSSAHNTIMFVDGSAQKVGINTTSPDEVLHIFGDAPKIKIENSAENSGGILFVDQQDEGQNAKIFFDASARSLDFHTDGAEAMTITGTSNGRKVGIGTTSPYEQLEVESQSSTSPAIVAANQASNGCFNMAHGYSGANGDYVNTYSTQYSSIATVIGFGVKASTDTNDQFLCSADNSNFTRGALVIDDELRFWQAGAQNGTLNNAITMTERFRLTAAGVGHFDSDVVAYSSTVSDKRLKENITTIDNALDKVMALRGVEYDWTATSRKGTHDIGLVAQEVEEVIPELVTEHELCTGEFGGEGNEKTFKTVNYDKMVGVLIEAIKELKTEIEELKK